MLRCMSDLVALLATLTLGGGAETIDHDTQGTASAQALVGSHQVDKLADSIATAAASMQLRDGSSSTDVAGALDARWEGSYDLGNGERLPILGAWLDGALGSRPALDARRDVGRATYAGTSAGFRLAAFGAEDNRRATILRFGFGGDRLWQGDQRRAEMTAEFGLADYCFLNPGGEAWCLHLLDAEAVGVSGKQQATVTNFTIARATGLAGHFEIGIGLVTDTVALSNKEKSNDPADWVITENLPRKTVLAGSLGAVAQVGEMRVSLRGVRTGYVSLDHDLSIEDRATLTAALPLDAHSSITATGFAARTRWWSSAMDPGSSAVTGGGELAVGTRVEHFDLRASAGVAQSFYPELDGAALAAPAVGVRSTVQLSRAIDL